MRFDATSAALTLIVGVFTPAIAQQEHAAIMLERFPCFGSCPAYLLRIDSSGAVSFKRGAPASWLEEETSTITADQFQALVAEFTKIHFFELKDVYPPRAEDLPEAIIELTLNGNMKRIKHGGDRPPYGSGPPELEKLERTIERVVNVHRWLHADPARFTPRFTLQSPVSGPHMGGGEDLKNEDYVRQDAYTRIKPGMNLLMQAAGEGDAAAIRRVLQAGENVNAADETGWTALMIAAVAVQPESVSAILEAGAQVNQRDDHRDTALIGAASVRFGNLRTAAAIVGNLLAHGASVEATNELGESALMWAARAGNPDSIKVLLTAGANPARADQLGHNALFYLRDARGSLTFDQALVERYGQAESVLEQR